MHSHNVHCSWPKQQSTMASSYQGSQTWPHIESIDSASIPSQYPVLFAGLGTLKRVEYTIRLKLDAQPFSLHASRNVPLPLKEETDEELKRMEQLGVISKVSEPTEWCAGMVVVPKESGKV